MPYENFLINPPKRIKRNKVKRNAVRRRLRRNFLGEELMVIGNSPRRRKRRKSTILSSLRRLKKRLTSNKPKAKGGVNSMARKRRRRRRNAVAANPRRRRRSYRRNPVAANPRRRRRNPVAAANPRRRRRRNPISNPVAVGGISLTKPQTLIPYLLTGAGSMIAVAKVPTMIGADSALWKYGSQALTAIGGGWLIGKFLGKNHGFVWAIAGGSVIASDIISNYILKQAGISGIGEDLIETSPEAMEGYPYSEIGYYPEMSGYPYSEVGAYPYEYV